MLGHTVKGLILWFEVVKLILSYYNTYYISLLKFQPNSVI